MKRFLKCLSLAVAMVLLAAAAVPFAQAEANETPIIFTYVCSSEPDTLDPSVWFTTSPMNLNVYQPLMRVNPEGSEEPYTYLVAESYTVSEDGLRYVFKIREGMTFHDGTTVNAEAVRASVQRTLDIAASPAGIWNCVAEMNVLSEYEIEFVLTAPVPFDAIVAAGYGSFITSPTAVSENETDGDLAQAWMTDNSCGTGPWMLSEWTRGERMVFVRNESYFGGWEKGQPDIVIIKFTGEYSTSRLMLESGEADMVDFVPADQIDELSQVEGVACPTYPSYETLYLQFNHQLAPTDNQQVRQALSYAFNYDGVTKITNNTSRPMRGILPSSLWGWDADAFQYTYDLQKARELLDEAGYKDQELVLNCYYSAEDDVLRQVVEMFKSDLASINVTLNVETAPFSTIASKQREFATSANIFTRYWWCDYVDPNDYVYYLLHSDANYTITYFQNDEINAKIEQAHEIAGVDREQAIEIYREINDFVIEDAHSIYAFEKDVVVPMRTWVEGFEYNPAYPRIVEFYELRINK